MAYKKDTVYECIVLMTNWVTFSIQFIQKVEYPHYNEMFVVGKYIIDLLLLEFVWSMN
jgi:hypothetical protein